MRNKARVSRAEEPEDGAGSRPLTRINELDGPAGETCGTLIAGKSHVETGKRSTESPGALVEGEVMDPHNDFDKHDRAPYDIAPATNTAYRTIVQQRDRLEAENRDMAKELVLQLRVTGELLEALTAFVAAFNGHEIEESLWPLMDQARIAISRAGGGK